MTQEFESTVQTSLTQVSHTMAQLAQESRQLTQESRQLTQEFRELTQESKRTNRKIEEVLDQIGRLSEGLFEIKLDIREQKEVANNMQKLPSSKQKVITRMLTFIERQEAKMDDLLQRKML